MLNFKITEEILKGKCLTYKKSSKTKIFDTQHKKIKAIWINCISKFENYTACLLGIFLKNIFKQHQPMLRSIVLILQNLYVYLYVWL